MSHVVEQPTGDTLKSIWALAITVYIYTLHLYLFLSLCVCVLLCSCVFVCVILKVIIYMKIIAFHLTPPTHKQRLISLDYLHTSLGTLVWLIISFS